MGTGTRERKAKIPLVGGPNDGMLVPDCGIYYFEPIMSRASAYIHDEAMGLPPSDKAFEKRCYRLYFWRDEKGNTARRYVLEDIADGLGAKPPAHPS